MKKIHLALLLATGIAACRDAGPVNPVDLMKTVPQGAVQVVLERQAGATAGTVTYIVRVVSNGLDVSAYQGVVSFQPGAYSLVGIETPAGADGDFRVANPSDFASGQVKFAAFAPAGFTSTEAFRLTVKPTVSGIEPLVSGDLSVVGQEDGAAIESAKVLSSKGVRDALTGRLIPQ